MTQTQNKPILWCDLETTGLDIDGDIILEIALVLTDGDLTTVGEPFQHVVGAHPAELDTMDEWCTKTHTESGLVEESSKLYKEQIFPIEVEERAIAWLKSFGLDNEPVLAGSTVASFDRQFLRLEMPRLHGMLHYRNIDVSTIKELCKRWRPDIAEKIPKKKDVHRALPDIMDSIELLRIFRKEWLV